VNFLGSTRPTSKEVTSSFSLPHYVSRPPECTMLRYRSVVPQVRKLASHSLGTWTFTGVNLMADMPSDTVPSDTVKWHGVEKQSTWGKLPQ
jgi:hypothetical protein